MAESGADAADIYMYFVPPGEIEGETTDRVMRDLKAFQCKEVTITAKNEENIGQATGGTGGTGTASANKGAGKVKFEAVKITKWTDKATPGLFKACGQGSTLPEAVIVYRRSGATDADSAFLTVYLYQCAITSVEMKASDDEEMTDEIEVDYATIKIEYRPQTGVGEKRGRMGDKKVMEWNRTTSKGS